MSRTSGFLPEERAELDRWIDAGWVDAFRALHPEAPDQYAWWQQWGGARERNIGWRIDYVFASPAAMRRIHEAFLWPDERGWHGWVEASAGSGVGAAVGAGALAPGQRWSASRKRDMVLRLLRGESLDMVSRAVGVEFYRLEAWVENTFFRDTSIIGDGLRARSPAGQGSEAVLGCEILNRMTALGRPVSYRIGR